jgi:predicted O-methyltransferase YrrM
MYAAPRLALKYLHYLFNSAGKKGHGTHSPFVFEFIGKVLNDSSHYEAYHKAEQLRSELLKNARVISVEDFGAGSVMQKEKERSIASIARSAAKPRKYGKLLYRMVQYYQPQTILELGTSLGITTSYLSMAKPDAKIITMEGASQVASLALQHFKKLSLKNIQLVEGNFDNTLTAVLRQHPVIDFAFIDGNHRREPTESYFLELIPHLHNDSIIVFDDIHWSREMEQAWENIKNHPVVMCTINLFFIGIVIFRQEFREKQHFSIRFKGMIKSRLLNEENHLYLLSQ